MILLSNMWTPNLNYVILLNILFGTCKPSTFSKFQLQPNFQNYKCAVDDLIISKGCESQIQCAVSCKENTGCRSWYYSDVDQLCFGCNTTYFSVSTLQTHMGTVYFYKDECPEGWVFLYRSCYLFSDDLQVLVPAWTYCEDPGSHLVFVETEDENKALKQHISAYFTTRTYWLAANNKSGYWKWYGYSTYFSSSDVVVVDDWVDEQSTSSTVNCVVLNVNGWQSADCLYPAYPLCEKELL